MTRKNTAGSLETIDGTVLLPVPTPPINLHDLEAVRREMARVYRSMASRKIDPQDGTRLVYVLTQIGKLHEAVDLVRRLDKLEERTNGDR